jgi:hypothetical protein
MSSGIITSYLSLRLLVRSGFLDIYPLLTVATDLAKPPNQMLSGRV